MEINIKDKDIELKFGMAFIRDLNKEAGLWREGINIGMALQKTLPAVLAGDLEAVVNVLYCGTAHIKVGRPKKTDFDDFMDNCDNIEKLTEDLIDALKEANLTKAPLKQMLDQMTNN